MPTFEIKKFQSMRTLDGGGFSYDLYIDGKKAAFILDEGHGGGVFARWYDQKLEAVLEAHVATLPDPPPSDGFQMKMDAELFFYQLADEYEMAKKLRRACKTKTLYRMPGDKIFEVKRPFSPEIKAHILSKHPEAKFINEEVTQ